VIPTDWQAIWSTLGIDKDLVSACKLSLCEDANQLVSAGMDIFNREQFVTPSTLQCWLKMQSAAAEEDITLSIVSAFRSVEYQCELIRNKLTQGQLIQDIVQVNAIPGFSEHHTGKAIDISTDSCDPLTEEFDKTPAFQWLTENAHLFEFVMSYPKNNSHNIIYEPWHWMCRPAD
jgi:D-alanyl-D-alanine carboxypeptidase